MQEWFEEWFDSPYYHILYKNRSEDEATKFVETIVKHFHTDAGQTLLDMACGKGRHSVAFASHGLDVTGIDLSRNSIDFALKSAHDKLHFYVHDMRHTFRTNYYDMVCNLFTSFGYFKTAHDNLLAAKSMHDAVKPNGIVLVDFVNRNFAIQNIDAKKVETQIIEKVQFNIKRSYTAQRLIKQIDIDDEGKTFHFQESLNSFTLSEMTTLFTSAGLTLQQVFGNYQLEAYHELSSPRMILIFTK